jgi:hypothetical protein
MKITPAVTCDTVQRKQLRWNAGLLLRVIAASLFFSSLTTVATAAEGRALTVYTGFRDGGSFEDNLTGNSVSLQSSEVYAASLDVPLDESTQFQVFYSFQDSSLVLNAVTPGSMTSISELPLQVMYLHLGGTSFIGGEIGKGAYVVGGLGATLLEPTSAGYDSEMRLSANVGLGYQLPLGKHMALRFEARGYFTMINSSGGMFCSGGCTVAISGTGVAQGEVLIGLSFGL